MPTVVDELFNKAESYSCLLVEWRTMFSEITLFLETKVIAKQTLKLFNNYSAKAK